MRIWHIQRMKYKRISCRFYTSDCTMWQSFDVFSFNFPSIWLSCTILLQVSCYYTKLMYYVTRDINLAYRFKANAWPKKNLELVASLIRSSPRIGPSNILGLRAEPKPDSCHGSFLAHNEFTLKKIKKNAPGSNYCCFLYVASCVFIKKSELIQLSSINPKPKAWIETRFQKLPEPFLLEQSPSHKFRLTSWLDSLISLYVTTFRCFFPLNFLFFD